MDLYAEPVAAIVREAMGVIQEYRDKRDWSRDELAEAACAGRQTVYNLEGGKTKRPSFPMVLRLWLVLEIPPDLLAEIIKRHSTKNPD